MMQQKPKFIKPISQYSNREVVKYSLIAGVVAFCAIVGTAVFNGSSASSIVGKALPSVFAADFTKIDDLKDQKFSEPAYEVSGVKVFFEDEYSKRSEISQITRVQIANILDLVMSGREFKGADLSGLSIYVTSKQLLNNGGALATNYSDVMKNPEGNTNKTILISRYGGLEPQNGEGHSTSAYFHAISNEIRE